MDYEDEGDYTCEASNGVGIAKSYSISLAVHASPYFTKVSPSNTQYAAICNMQQCQSLSLQEPESQTAAEGESVIFECEAGGFPAPKVSNRITHRCKTNHLLTLPLSTPPNIKTYFLPDQLGAQREEDRGRSPQPSQNGHQQLHHDCQPDKTGEKSFCENQMLSLASQDTGNYGCNASAERVDG